MTLQDRFEQAQTLRAAGDLPAARDHCQRILLDWPGQGDTLHLLGLLALDCGDVVEAILQLRQACAAPNARASYFSNLAELCRRLGRYAEGEKAGRRAVTLDPGSPAVWNNLGIILQEAGQFAESKACLDRVLALTPDNPQAHNNFANTCKRLGELALAERHWFRALALQETYPEVHSNLATLFTALGAYDKAAAHAQRAIALRPGFADAYLNLAMVEAARDDHKAALAALDQVLVFAPENATAMAAKALALKQLDQLEEALLWAQRASNTDPQNAEAAQALGQVWQAIGETEAARRAYERAASLPGTAAEKALSGLALLLMEQGGREAAEAAFDTALRVHPRSATLHYNRADLKRFTEGDPDIESMLALLGPGGCESDHDRMLLRFALGNAYLQLGDAGNAFLHLDEGNRMKRATIRYDSATTLRWMGEIAQLCDGGRLAQASPGPARAAAPGDFTPVFILGMPRSGTTLVEQILASHPAIHGAGELSLFPRTMEAAGAYPASVPSLTATGFATVGEGYKTAVARRVARARQTQQSHIIDKMPANFLYAGVIHAALPDARIVHCQRNPVDTCLSCYSKLFTHEQLFTYDQTELGLFYRGYQDLMMHWRRLLPRTHFLDVAYEDVVADMEGAARRMLDFLGLDWSPLCRDFHRTARPVRTASVNQVRRPIYTTSVARWKRYAGKLGPLLTALGV